MVTVIMKTLGMVTPAHNQLSVSRKETKGLHQMLPLDGNSRDSLHSFKTETFRCEEIPVQRTLMEEQWKEWMDEQEMKGNHNTDEQRSEKQ